MRALAVFPPVQIGDTASALRDVHVDPPAPKSEEVQVRVLSSTINIDDIHMVEGTMFGGIPVGPKVPEGQPVVPGTDVAGVVSAIGSGVKDFRVGDEVFGTHDPRDARGAWGEFCCVRQERLLHKPKVWSFGEAAAYGLGGLVAAAAVEAARPEPGVRCIVAGASSGIGNIIAQSLIHSGAEVIGVCSTRNVQRIRELGLVPHDYTTGSFADQYSNINIVIDCVGGPELEREGFRVLQPRGRFITLVGPERYIGERKLPWSRILGIFWHIFCRTVAGQFRGPKYTMVAPTAKHRKLIDRWFAQPGVHPLIDCEIEMSVEAVSEGIRHVLSHRASGKVILLAPATDRVEA